MTPQQIYTEEKKFFKEFLIHCFIVLVTIVLVYLVVTGITKRPDNPGTFGDLFGVGTCIFSGLAFSGLLYTVKIQKLELRITRDELIETARANKATAEATVKNLEVQRLTAIIRGREAILAVLSGPNQSAIKAVVDRTLYENSNAMINEYALDIKNALNALAKINQTNNP